MRSIHSRSLFTQISITPIFLSSPLLPCFLLSFFLLASSMSAQTTVAVAEDIFGSDARLNQTVAIHVEGVPVGELLTLLSEKTGVSLKADAYVADDKVIAFSPTRPLRETLNAIAALYNDVWQIAPSVEPISNVKFADKKLADSKSQDEKTSNDKNAKPRYVLTRRLSARHYEDDLEQAITARLLAQLDA